MPKDYVDVESLYDIKDMYRYIQNASMDCQGFVSDNDMQDLFDLMNAVSDSCESPMNVSLITEDRIRYPNCEINQTYMHNGKQKWDKFKVIIFPDAHELIKQHESNGVIIGFVHLLYDNTLNCILPLGIIDGYSDIKPSDMFARDPMHKTPYMLERPISDAIQNMMFFIIAVWSVFQLAETDPFFRDLVIFTKTQKNITCKLNDQIIRERLAALSK